MLFNSFRFKKFANNFDYQITTSSSHRSNRQAERAVQTTKKLLKKCSELGSDLEVSLLKFRNTPITGLNVSSPAQILFSRRTRTKILIHTKFIKPTAKILR